MLKCRVNTKEFQEGLKKVEIATAKKSEVQMLENVKLTVAQGELKLTATDLMDYMTITIDDVVIESEGEIVIRNIKDIIKSFKFMKEFTTEIEVNNNNDLIITNGSRNIKLSTDDAEDFPKCFEVGIIDNEYSYNTKTLHNRIKKIDFARSKDDTRPTLTGIRFNESDIVAIDGYRVALSNDPLLRVDKSFIIAPGTVNLLLKTLNNKVEDNIKISTNDKYAILDYNNVRLTSRLIEGQYFNYKDIFPKEYKSVSLQTKKIKEDIEFLSVHTDKLIHMIFNNNRIELKANNEEGTFNVEHNIDHEINAHIGFNKKFMLDVLKTVNSESIEVGISGELAPIFIKEDESFKHIVLPVRLDKSAS